MINHFTQPREAATAHEQSGDYLSRTKYVSVGAYEHVNVFSLCAVKVKGKVKGNVKGKIKIKVKVKVRAPDPVPYRYSDKYHERSQ